MRHIDRRANHKDGEKRARTFFALLPVRVGYETRWLEYVSALESYSLVLDTWFPIEFLNK